MKRARSAISFCGYWAFLFRYSYLFFSCAVVNERLLKSNSTNHGGGPLVLSQDQDQGKGADMNPKLLVKLIKKEKRESQPVRSETELVSDENRWSRAVRAWVNDFQQN